MTASPLHIPHRAKQEQYIASDPALNSWVSAHAGSGKTHVLTQRVIRLLLSGSPPDRLLCLTFTKAAAANMKNRIFKTLQSWTMMEDSELNRSIENLTGQRPGRVIRQEARRLFAVALDSPGGLKIQTIHAFCESLLHQFPLEANVPGQFETLTETEQQNLLAEAKMEVLAGEHTSSELFTNHYVYLLSHVSDDAIANGVGEIVRMRSRFSDWTKQDPETAINNSAEYLGIDLSVSGGVLIRQCLEKVPATREQLIEFSQACDNTGTDVGKRLSDVIVAALNGDQAAPDYLSVALLTKQKKLRSTNGMPPKAVKERFSWSEDVIEQLKSSVDKIRLQKTLNLSKNLFVIAEHILERYAQKKRQLGMVDFDDLIEKCSNLLNRTEIRDWIRYRLDRGIDHLLVDEAQDTSPTQWSIINAIAEDFHTGATAANKNRTLFVVGDEKQSIFSFQGADPKEFQSQKKNLESRLNASGFLYHDGKLQFSFRSTPDVLHAVDKVFSVDANAQGLTQENERPVHDAIRSADPGEVYIWPMIEAQRAEESDDWMNPVDRTSERDSAKLLAEKITDEIEKTVGTMLPGRADPIQFKDILVLVRKRNRFVDALTRTMKDRGLSVAGADRLHLVQHIAAEDLLAIARMVLLAEDDLNLACVLKGPLFNLDDSTLEPLCTDRASLCLEMHLRSIKSQVKHAHHDIAKTIVNTIDELKLVASKTDPFGFFALLLGRYGMRKALVSKLGHEAEDVIDAFLEEAMQFRSRGGAGLEQFVDETARSEKEIKREIEFERDEVRILTVHASKGLEASIVFLVDPGDPAWNGNFAPKVLPVKLQNNAESYLWVPTADLANSVSEQSLETIKTEAEAEYRRLLYVGMTRAADRLVVCGFGNGRDRKHDHWQRMVQNALADSAEEIVDKDGEIAAWRWSESRQASVDQITLPDIGETAEVPEPLPGWLLDTNVQPSERDAELNPSSAHDWQSVAQSVPQWQEATQTNPYPLERGEALHRLLEFFTDEKDREAGNKIDAFLKRRYGHWSDAQRADTSNTMLRLLRSGVLDGLFAENSEAEVNIAGRVNMGAREVLVTGVVDRIVLSNDRALIVDYKSDMNPPDYAGAIPEKYLLQLALYQELVRKIYQEKEVSTAILWIQNANLMQVDEELLDSAMVALNNQ